MTPSEKLGLKIGDKIEVIEGNDSCVAGDILEFIRDDRSPVPEFRNLSTGEDLYYGLNYRKWKKAGMKGHKFWIGEDYELWSKMVKVLTDGDTFGPVVPSNYTELSLYRRTDGNISWGSTKPTFDEEVDYEEVNIDWMRTTKPKETVELLGKTFIREDVEKALGKSLGDLLGDLEEVG